MSDKVKAIIRWVGYFLLAITRAAAGGASTQLL